MPKLSPNEELRLLVKVSKLYYEDDLGQDEIKARLGLSRSKISRLLSQARQDGIVQISIVAPGHLFSDLERRLERQFGLQEALVIESQPGEGADGIGRALGAAAARYLARSVDEKTIIGVSWGRTLHYMAEALAPQQLPEAQVVQIIGGLGQPDAEVHATELCRRMARSLGCRLALLPVPGIVPDQRTRQVLLSNVHVQRAVDTFERLDIAFVGVGAPTPNSVVLQDGSIITQSELDCLLEKGAVGDIALRFFDSNGRGLTANINDRIIGITLEQLKRIRRVVGVSGGPEKSAALLGALRGGLINVLITDSLTAQKLVEAN